MSAQSQPDRVVTLQRRRAEDGCGPTFTGPFTRTVPAASIDTALADVQHSLPAGAVVVQPPSAAAATSGPGRSKMPPLPEDRARRRRVIEERVFRIAAFHAHNPSEARKAKTEVMSYRVLHEKIIENAEAQYGPEAEIPATFMPLSFLTDPPADDVRSAGGVGTARSHCRGARRCLLPSAVGLLQDLVDACACVPSEHRGGLWWSGPTALHRCSVRRVEELIPEMGPMMITTCDTKHLANPTFLTNVKKKSDLLGSRHGLGV